MAKLSFRDVLVQIGFSTKNAFRQELILGSLIAERLRVIAEEEHQNNKALSAEFVKEEIKKDYTAYFEHMAQDLHLSQKLLAKEKLDEYLKSF